MYGQPSEEPQPFVNPEADYAPESSSDASQEALAAHKKKPDQKDLEMPEDNPISQMLAWNIQRQYRLLRTRASKKWLKATTPPQIDLELYLNSEDFKFIKWAHEIYPQKSKGTVIPSQIDSI